MSGLGSGYWRRGALRAAGRGRRSRRAAGLTMVELLIVVAVIGLITVFVIPNFLIALDKAKQKKTMADMHDTGKAFMMWLTDQVGAAAAGARIISLADYGPPLTADDLKDYFVPQYMAVLPEIDGWGHAIEYYVDTADLEDGTVLAIRSPGRDGLYSGDDYPLRYFIATDFDHDLLWADGIFITWPQTRPP